MQTPVSKRCQLTEKSPQTGAGLQGREVRARTPPFLRRSSHSSSRPPLQILFGYSLCLLRKPAGHWPHGFCTTARDSARHSNDPQPPSAGGYGLRSRSYVLTPSKVSRRGTSRLLSDCSIVTSGHRHILATSAIKSARCSRNLVPLPPTSLEDPVENSTRSSSRPGCTRVPRRLPHTQPSSIIRVVKLPSLGPNAR